MLVLKPNPKCNKEILRFKYNLIVDYVTQVIVWTFMNGLITAVLEVDQY